MYQPYFQVCTLSVILKSPTMTGSKILVLGATGPAGICLLRELVYREHLTIVYARNPSKIPEDLASNPLLEVRKL